MSRSLEVQPGLSYPLGANIRYHGVNFSLFSRFATEVELLLFDDEAATRPSRVIKLDARRHRTFHYWHAFVPGVEAGQLYGYRVHGPYRPDEGLRFDASKVLLDPYAQAVSVGSRYDRDAAMRFGHDNAATAMKSVVVDPRAYDWEGDRPLRVPYAGSVIYEMHVRGFTAHESSGLSADKRGTYAGVIEKIPYLRRLGITAVELLPVQQFDPGDAPKGMINYWGYGPVAFFAPHAAYSSKKGPMGAIDEFRDMVKALHRAGIEVILDVVFNHTAEGGEKGPTLCFKGLENTAYYMLRPPPEHYANYTGCGNTINANHSVVRRMVLDCLRYWVQNMHVDGFRFDLASVLSRDESGVPLKDPPILWEIESDPLLAGVKIIAEAWDAGGLYQVGSFIGHRWAEWNGRYRDDVRAFLKGDDRSVGPLAARLTGSQDIYRQPDREPNRSINFVTCHDGFTLADLVSYNKKHNEANLEQNRDGTDANLSWNCGAEGPTGDQAVLALRERQIKNALAILALSQGTPMLLMGDEVRRSQRGNNNAYCQDNELSWFDWGDVEKNAGLLRYTRKLIAFGQCHDFFQQEQFWVTDEQAGRHRVTWHGTKVAQPDWSPTSHSLAMSLQDPASGEVLYAAFNAFWEHLDFELPTPGEGRVWRRVIDTTLSDPDDIADPGLEPEVRATRYRVGPRSVLVLLSRP